MSGMVSIEQLLSVVDAYKTATGVTLDTTVSYRVFGDSKKLGSMRSGADITTRRFNAALEWFSNNWPENSPRPVGLPSPDEDAA